MIYVGIDDTPKPITCNENNSFAPIKIGINENAVNVIKIFIGDENGHAKEVYFNHLYDFRHTFNIGQSYATNMLLSYNNILDRVSSDVESSNMTLYISSTEGSVHFDPEAFIIGSDDYKKYYKILEYNNITSVIFDIEGDNSVIIGLNMFEELEFLELPSFSEIINMFNGSNKLKTVIVKGHIDHIHNSFRNLYDGSSILCFNDTETYNTISMMMETMISDGMPRYSIIYDCREDELYTEVNDGYIGINNNSPDDNKIQAMSFINKIYTKIELDNIL